MTLFPAWRHHAIHESVIVRSEEEANNLGPGWFEAPWLAIEWYENQKEEEDKTAPKRRGGRPRKVE